MLNRKLLTILSLFDNPTYKRCHKFLLSPYFNDAYNADKLVALFEHIRKYKAKLEHPQLQKGIVFKVVFSQKAYTEGDLELDLLMSDLLKLVKQFLVQENKPVEVDKEFDELLAQSLFFGKHGIVNSFNQTIERAQKHLSKQKVKGSDFFNRKYLIERTSHDFQSVFNNGTDDNNLLETHKYLDTYYATLKLELACAMSFMAHLIKLDTQVVEKLTNSLLPMIDKGEITVPMLTCYSKIMQIQKENCTLANVRELEILLKKSEQEIPKSQYFSMQACVRNFWVRLYNKKSNLIELQQIFDIYKWHLARGFMYQDSKLQPSTMLILVKMGLKLHEYDWVKQFLEEHTADKLWNLEQPQELYDLNRSMLYFHLKEYDKAEALLNNKFKNAYYDASSTVLIIMIYYETDSPILDDRINSFRVKIARSKMPEPRRQFFYNFLNRLTKIISLRNTYDKEPKRKLLEEITEEKNIAEKEWLLQKVQEMLT